MFFDMTTGSTKTGPRTENRTPDYREILCANEPACQKIFAYLKIYSILPSEVKKTGNQTENRTPDQPLIFVDEPV